MSGMTATDRADLDSYIRILAAAGGDLTLETFRERRIQQAIKTEGRVRNILYGAGLLFMALLVAQFVWFDRFGERGWIVSWTLSLGGLGAVASLLLHVLKLMPQEALQRSDRFEVPGRIFLGCLFSLVLSLTLIFQPLTDFYDTISKLESGGAPKAGLQLLLPFLCGYSIPLVLGLLAKSIQAIELTLGLTDPKDVKRSRTRRP